MAAAWASSSGFFTQRVRTPQSNDQALQSWGIGGMGKTHPGDRLSRPVFLGGAAQAVFAFRLKLRPVRQHAEVRRVDVRREVPGGIRKERKVAPELIYNYAERARPVGRRKQVPGTHDLREDTSALDVGYEQPFPAEMPNRAKVDDVPRGQV
jgi:hypothetical protein